MLFPNITFSTNLSGRKSQLLDWFIFHTNENKLFHYYERTSKNPNSLDLIVAIQWKHSDHVITNAPVYGVYFDCSEISLKNTENTEYWKQFSHYSQFKEWLQKMMVAKNDFWSISGVNLLGETAHSEQNRAYGEVGWKSSLQKQKRDILTEQEI